MLLNATISLSAPPFFAESSCPLRASKVCISEHKTAVHEFGGKRDYIFKGKLIFFVCFERLLEKEKEEKIKTIIKWFIISRNRHGSSDNPGMSVQ